MRQCEICGKGSRIVGKRIKLRGHFNPTIKKRKFANLQKAISPSGERVLACTDCIRGFTKETRKAKASV